MRRKHTVDSILSVAKTFESRGEYWSKDQSCYNAGRRLGIHEQACAHMQRKGNLYNRALYKLTNSDGDVYYGLTCDLKRREASHRKNLTISEPFEFQVLTDYMPVNEAARLEKRLISNARKTPSFNCKNASAGGQLGSAARYWTKDRVLQEAKAFSNRAEFRNRSGSAYNSCLKMGMIEEACRHMGRTLRHRWTEKELLTEACKYQSKSEFHKLSPAAYQAACRFGLLDKCCEHMDITRAPPGHYNIFENVEAVAKNCLTVRSFYTKYSAAYQSANRNGWLDQVCKHMSKGCKPTGYYNIIENVRSEAAKYRTASKFKEGSGSAYGAARRNGWFDEVCAHMSRGVPKGHYSKLENVMAEAAKYSSRSEFSRKAKGAYASASKNGWMNEVCAHMGKPWNIHNNQTLTGPLQYSS